jgi:hypothetical protein
VKDKKAGKIDYHHYSKKQDVTYKSNYPSVFLVGIISTKKQETGTIFLF